MASVIDSRSQARKDLDFALGKGRVSLSNLSEKEQDELLRDTLYEVNLRELRGFKPLKDLLVFRPSSSGGRRFHTLELESLELDPQVDFSLLGERKSELLFGLETYVMDLCRGWRNVKIIFKQYETGTETSDMDEARSWGKSAYHYKGSGEVLVLRRPRNHTRGDENLFIIGFQYEKVPVPLENRHVITKLEVQLLTVENFRSHFGASSARALVELVWELRTAYGRTVLELESQLTSMRRKCAELERLADAISYR